MFSEESRIIEAVTSGKVRRNILLDDRLLDVVPRIRGCFLDETGAFIGPTGTAFTGAFENRDAPTHGVTR